MVGETSWIGSSYEVVYMSAVILFVMRADIKNEQHNHKSWKLGAERLL